MKWLVLISLPVYTTSFLYMLRIPYLVAFVLLASIGLLYRLIMQ